MNDPFTKEVAREVDVGNVLEVYEKWPTLAREGYKANVEVPTGNIRSAAVLGMGGSAAGGEILAGWLAGAMSSEVAVYKGRLPPVRMKDVLAIACSASGGTQETIDMMKSAFSRGAKVVSITSGGTLMEESVKRGIPVVHLPTVPAPRYSLPYIIFSSLSLIGRAFSIDTASAAEKAFEGMDDEGKEISIGTPIGGNRAKQLALHLLNKTPSIYGARVTRGVGVRFENVLNENSKKHAHFDEIPDALHNEVESWESRNTGFAPVILRHPAESPHESQRAEDLTQLLKEELKRYGQDPDRGPHEVRGRGRSSLAQLLTMVYRLDLVTYYIALGKRIDPLPTRLIDTLKMKRRAT